MQSQKVAIVVDNNLEASQKLISEIGSKYSDVTVFDLSATDVNKLNVFYLYRLIFRIENLDLSKFDLVYSLSTGFANGVITNLDTEHKNIMLGIPDWFLKTDSAWIKAKLRLWLNLAMARPNRNYLVLPGQKDLVLKLNPSAEFSKLEFEVFTKFQAEEANEKLEHYVLFASLANSDFTIEVSNLFNKTGKKLVVVGDKNLENQADYFSDLVEFVDVKNLNKLLLSLSRAKGIIFDQYFCNYELLQTAIRYNTSMLTYRNKFIANFFNSEKVFELNNIDNFENDFAQFVSWSKINKSKQLYFPKLK